MSDLHARCPDCGHVWLVAKLPMEMSEAARRAEVAICPNGCAPKPLASSRPVTVVKVPYATSNSGVPGIAAVTLAKSPWEE